MLEYVPYPASLVYSVRGVEYKLHVRTLMLLLGRLWGKAASKGCNEKKGEAFGRSA